MNGRRRDLHKSSRSGVHRGFMSGVKRVHRCTNDALQGRFQPLHS
jgi:hypothetical protein